MPKESKRFINPLLRPTVEVETKQEEVQTTQLEQPVSPVRTNTSTATSMETVTPPRSAEQAVPVSQVTESRPSAKRRVAHPSTDTYTTQEATEIAGKLQMREPLHPGREVEPEISLPEVSEREDVIPYTTSSVIPAVIPEYSDDQTKVPKTRLLIDRALKLSPPTVAEMQPFPSPSHSDELSISTVSHNLSSEPTTSTYTFMEPKLSSTHSQDDEVVEREQRYIAPPPSRRKRGDQAFEKTHERITLWIDKRLKQAFEELADEQEISKTALLNEAMADLLNKYASH